MEKRIKSALISVFDKEGLDKVAIALDKAGIDIYSTGGTQSFIEKLGIKCNAVETLTEYPSILGGRVKTLHPKVFGGILARRAEEKDLEELAQFSIPEIDLVIVDLYPFEKTVSQTSDETTIIEKIDIGGVALIRAAAKNFKDVLIISSINEYEDLTAIVNNGASTDMHTRKSFAANAFQLCAHYDTAISTYFSRDIKNPYYQHSYKNGKILRYGENPHQQGVFYEGKSIWEQLNGKELSYNNLVDIDAAIDLIKEFSETTFAVIKHTNVCGVASRPVLKDAWDTALAGDPESAFGGVLVCNKQVDTDTASSIAELFFEVLIAPSFEEAALEILKSKKNRILLRLNSFPEKNLLGRSIANGVLVQNPDNGNFEKWEEVGGRKSSEQEKSDLEFSNIICKHLKSNAIALVKNKQLIGKGAGQTSRIDALRHAIEKAKQFGFDLQGAVLASDAFFPFDDCVKMSHEAGITAFIQPGGSIRDKDSIEYCKANNLAMVMTGIRHFKH